MREELQLENIRSNLIRQEETIIFSLIERAQYKQNKIIYQEGKLLDTQKSFLEYLLHMNEIVYAKVRRYTAPDEHPFTKDLPQPIINSLKYDWPIKKTNININDKIFSLYIDKIIPQITEDGDCGNYGSSAVCDVASLQAISKRIHYGKFVAESKFLQDQENYSTLIMAHDRKGLIKKLTNANVEKKVLKRVKLKTSTYGQDPTDTNPIYKIHPELVAKIYEEYIIPLTKEIEILYLLQRI